MLKFTVLQNVFFALTLINSLVLIVLFDPISIDTHLFSISIPTYISAVLSGVISYVVVPKLSACQANSNETKAVYSTICVLFVSVSLILLACQFVLFEYLFSHNGLYIENVDIVDRIHLNSTLAAALMVFNSIQTALLYFKERYLTAISINTVAVVLHLAIMLLFSSTVWIVSFALLLSQLFLSLVLLQHTSDCFVAAFRKEIFRDLLSSSASLLVSSSPAKFDIVQDRSLLSNTGGIIYLHYARLACDTLATSITKAFSIVQLTRLSKTSTNEFDNRSYLIIITTTSVLYFLVYVLAAHIDKTGIYPLAPYLEVYKLLFPFLVSAVSSTFLVNYFYSDQRFWPVSLASASVSVTFIGLKQYFFSGELAYIIPAFLSLRGFINSLLLFYMLIRLNMLKIRDLGGSLLSFIGFNLFGLIII